MWVRSYKHCDRLLLQSGAGQHHVGALSTCGLIGIGEGDSPVPSPKRLMLFSQATRISMLDSSGTGFRFQHFAAGDWYLTVPYWFAVGLTITATAAVWLNWHFSLRTLLIASTVVAVVLGLVVVVSS